MKNKASIILIFLLAAAIGILVYRSLPRENTDSAETPQNQPPSKYEVITENVIINNPLGNDAISSPLEVLGRAKGPWYFEASFPAEVLDEDGKILGVGVMKAQSEWMTTDFVPFKGTIIFNTPSGTKGTLVLKKDNPSGLPENEAEVRVPIFFQNTTSTQPPGTCVPGLACKDSINSIN